METRSREKEERDKPLDDKRKSNFLAKITSGSVRLIQSQPEKDDERRRREEKERKENEERERKREKKDRKDKERSGEERGALTSREPTRQDREATGKANHPRTLPRAIADASVSTVTPGCHASAQCRTATWRPGTA